MYVCILIKYLTLLPTNFKIKVYNKRGLEDGLEVKYVHCFCRGTEFGFKHSLLVGSAWN